MSSANAATRLWAAIAVSLALFLTITIAISFTGSAPTPLSANAAEGDTPMPDSYAISLTEFTLDPVDLTVPAGAPLTFDIANNGQAEHDYTIEGGPRSEGVPAGGTTTVQVADGLAAGQYRVFCSLPGHADAGMEGTLTATTQADGQRVQADTVHQARHAAMTPEEMVAGHQKGIDDFVAVATGKSDPLTEGRGNQLLEPTFDGDVKVFEVTADEVAWEVAPGQVKDGMAYNGQIPGPRIEANVGDTVRIVLHNKLDVPTAIHPHGLMVPVSQDGVPGLTQAPVMPGESFTYEYKLRNAGSHMYHSHFDSATQVPRGLLGAFVVHDTTGQESEVSLDYTMILNDGPLGYTINGKGFPATEALVVKQGQNVRVRYMNEGLQAHPMHLHGMPQLVIAKDGYPLAQPRTEDTVMVAPGERVDVIIEATELGAWAYHCHILNHAEAAEGMFGMVTALVVAE